MKDGENLHIALWDNAEKPKAVLQIVHGMAEHIARYDDFAKYLNECGIIVAGDDHRAHGQTHPNRLGLVGNGDLFENSVSDEYEITLKLKSLYNLPVIILGHSYGSFLVQRYLSLGYGDSVSGCVLMGSAAMEGFMVNIGASIANSRFKKGRQDEKGDTFANLTFHSYDKKIRDGINGWLSRDIEQVGKYNVDPLCGFVCSNGFYKFFFNGLKTIAADDGNKINKHLKLYIVSGGNDYVGGCGKLVQKLFSRYKRFGLNPELKIYDGARHEILNDINRGTVFEDIYTFITNSLKA